MKRVTLTSLMLVLCLLTPLYPQNSPSAQQLEAKVRDFLANVNSPAAHDRFWSEDLVYTGASGVRRTKTEIMKSVTEAAARPADPKEPKSSYNAEDITVHDYGDFAVVNFRLVHHGEENGKQVTTNFRNTGTFRKVNGKWMVIAWQATRIEEKK